MAGDHPGGTARALRGKSQLPRRDYGPEDPGPAQVNQHQSALGRWACAEEMKAERYARCLSVELQADRSGGDCRQYQVISSRQSGSLGRSGYDFEVID